MKMSHFGKRFFQVNLFVLEIKVVTFSTKFNPIQAGGRHNAKFETVFS